MRRYLPLIRVPTKNDLRPVVPIPPEAWKQIVPDIYLPDFGGFSPRRNLSVSFGISGPIGCKRLHWTRCLMSSDVH